MIKWLSVLPQLKVTTSLFGRAQHNASLDLNLGYLRKKSYPKFIFKKILSFDLIAKPWLSYLRPRHGSESSYPGVGC